MCDLEPFSKIQSQIKISESEDIMLGGLKTSCFIRVYLIAMNVQLEYFEYRYKKIPFVITI